LAQPPYFLLTAGLLMGITSGLAFEATLKQSLKSWSANRQAKQATEIQDFNLFFSFLGICIGVCIFLASGLNIFSIGLWFAYGFSILVTILIGGLIWRQLSTLLRQLQAGGSKAIDLDVFDI
jgi:hypothetical protein